MNSEQLETTEAKNVRLVPGTPHVKSAETCKLFNHGMTGNSKNGKITDPICYDAPVSRKTDPAVEAAGLFENQIRRDTMTSTPPRDMEVRWNELEHKHGLRCLWSEVIGNRTIQVECLWVPSASVTIMVTKHYEHPIPKNSYKKPFPKMNAHYAYFPAGGVTWKSMDEALTSLKSAVETPLTEDETKEINAA